MDEQALPFYFNSMYSPSTADADGDRAIYGPYY